MRRLATSITTLCDTPQNALEHISGGKNQNPPRFVLFLKDRRVLIGLIMGSSQLMCGQAVVFIAPLGLGRVWGFAFYPDRSVSHENSN